MTAREKKLSLLVLLATVLACGNYAYEYFFSAGGKSASSSSAVNNAIQGLGASLAAMPLGKAEAFILEESLRPPRRELFQLPQKQNREKKEEKRTAGATSLVYTGYIDVAGTKLAVISGMEYAENDIIPATGDVVRRITENAVALFSASRQTEWELPYSGDEF